MKRILLLILFAFTLCGTFAAEKKQPDAQTFINIVRTPPAAVITESTKSPPTS